MRVVRHIGFVLIALVAVAPAQTTDPKALVQQAVANELRAAQDTSRLYRYVLRKETKSGTSVREMIETKDGIVARTITWNDRELTPDERAKEDEKLARLGSSAEEQRKKFAEQREDARQAMKMLEALPHALLYEYGGREMLNGREAVRLRFKPNPDFSSTAKETYLFRGAEGNIWIDKDAKRIAKLDGVTTAQVNIGWGLLGHIDKGGKVYLEQTMVGPSTQWRISTLNLDAKGKALFFKSINIQQRQSARDFRPVSAMTVAEAVDFLRKSDAGAKPETSASAPSAARSNLP
jgi:hypothetical protein